MLHSGGARCRAPERVMNHRVNLRRRWWLGLAVALCAGLPVAGTTPPVTREDAARLRVKVEAIERNARSPRPAALVTHVTEREVNAYLAFDATSQLPAG